MHKRVELLTVLTDIFPPCGRRLGTIPDITLFLSRKNSVPLKLRKPKTDCFCSGFVEDDAGIPGVFQGGRNEISAKRTVFGVRRRFSYAYAKKHGTALKIFPAEWTKYGKRAGPIRNRQMIDYINGFENKVVIAFVSANTKGTRNTIAFAQKANIRVIEKQYTVLSDRC